MSHARQQLNSRLPRESGAGAELYLAVERVAGAFSRLDHTSDNHPLTTAYLYRTRLDAVRRQAAVHGRGIDAARCGASWPACLDRGRHVPWPALPGLDRKPGACKRAGFAGTACPLTHETPRPERSSRSRIRLAIPHDDRSQPGPRHAFHCVAWHHAVAASRLHCEFGDGDRIGVGGDTGGVAHVAPPQAGVNINECLTTEAKV